jgi:hypothetical protein
MTELTYPACIRELYESEIFGEAVFDALIDHARTPRERYHMATLLQLETETKARLRPFLLKHGISLNESMDLSMLPGIVEGYNALDWKSFMEANIPVVENFLASFEAIVAIGPKEEYEVLQSMVIHESAILKWLKIEAVGEDAKSLDDIISQLQYPLPLP